MDKNNSLDKSLKILDLFIDHVALSMSEAAKMLGYSTSATQRMLVTLEENNYLYRGADGLYRLAYKISLLSSNVEFSRQIILASEQLIDNLSARLGFSVNLSMMESGGVLIPIARSNNRQVRYLMPNLGTPGSPENSASGKMLLCACHDRERIIEKLQYNPYTAHSIRSSEELMAEFAEIERTGFAYDNEELVEGLFCVAKKIPLSSTALCALSVSGYKVAMLERIDMVREALGETVLQIQKNLEK